MKQNFPDVDFIQLKIETKYARDYGKKKESRIINRISLFIFQANLLDKKEKNQNNS